MPLTSNRKAGTMLEENAARSPAVLVMIGRQLEADTGQRHHADDDADGGCGRADADGVLGAQSRSRQRCR
jgi:hypothetical protein